MPSPRKHGVMTKRDAILAAAGELVLAGGYETTSMDAVAARAGVSKTTVYAHFADKMELFKAVMANAATEFGDGLEAALARAGGEDPEETLASALIEIVKAGTQPQMLAFYRILITETERRGQLSAGMEEVMAGSPDVIASLASLVDAYGAEKGFEVDEPEKFATMLMRLANSGVQLDMLLSDFRLSPRMLETHVRLVVGIVLRGMRPDRSGARVGMPEGYDYPWGPDLNRAAPA